MVYDTILNPHGLVLTELYQLPSTNHDLGQSIVLVQYLAKTGANQSLPAKLPRTTWF